MERFDRDRWSGRDVARLLSLVEVERLYYQQMMAGLPVGLAVLSTELSLLSVNRSFRRIFGLSREELQRIRIQELLPEEGLEARVREVLATGVPSSQILPVKCGEGERIVRLTSQPSRGWEAEPDQEVLFVLEDLSDGPRSQDRPARGPELLQGLGAVAWELDPNTLQYRFVSPHAAELLGYPPEDWSSTPDFLTQRAHPEDRAAVADFYRREKSGSCDYRAIRADGSMLRLRDHLAVVRDEAGQVSRLHGLTLDITGQTRRRELAGHSQKGEALVRVASRLSHECNNLLMIVTGYGEELLEALPSDNPLRGDIQHILTASQRLAALTGQLVGYTKLPPPRPEPFEVNPVLAGLEEKLQAHLGDAVELVLRLDPAAGNALADRQQIADVILALAIRSLQSMPQGGRFTLETAPAELSEDSAEPDGALPPGSYVRITVSDTGEKLDPSAKERLFEPSFSTDPEGEKLSGVYAVLRQNGAGIWIADEPAGGAAFHIYLPRPQASIEEASPAPAEAAAEPPPPPPPPPKVILVVEDEGGIRDLMRKTLQRHGYTVLEAALGDKALEIAKSHAGPIDLLLTDVDMPQMSGPEVADQLVAVRPTVRVLFVSGTSGEDALRSRPGPAGAAFLQKPFTLSALVGKVRELIDPEPPPEGGHTD